MFGLQSELYQTNPEISEISNAIHMPPHIIVSHSISITSPPYIIDWLFIKLKSAITNLTSIQCSFSVALKGVLESLRVFESQGVLGTRRSGAVNSKGVEFHPGPCMSWISSSSRWYNMEPRRDCKEQLLLLMTWMAGQG